MHYETQTIVKKIIPLFASYGTIYHSGFGGAGDGAFSFGLILTPSNFGLGLLGFEDVVDGRGGDVKGDDASLRSDGGGLSAIEEDALGLEARCAPALVCESTQVV